MRKKVCVITGTRADYGLLKPLIDRIENDNDLQLQVIATGMHLSPEFGLTYEEIEKDNVKIDEKIETLLSSDTTIGVSKSMGLGVISFAEAYNRLQPDIIVILGDRYEIFSAVTSAMISKIPVAHLHGGEATYGLIDESIRHSITKMSYLHFTSTEEYKKRVIQLGETPNRVFNVGAIGLENIKNMKLLSKKELEKSIRFEMKNPTVLVTFHPATLEEDSSEVQFENLLSCLDEFINTKIIFTKANADTHGRVINKMIDDYVKKNSNKSIVFTSLGQLRYLSAIKYVDAVIGNSSSGIIEVPAFKTPTVNIGDRQRGRIRCKSIIDCKPTKDEIKKAITKALSDDFKNTINDIVNPYGDGNVSQQIVEEIKKFLLNDLIDIKKEFYDIRMD
ncbi:UDP-N-acetylglucosamine 2-epimerase [Wukongibacter baidiensis]|uniref:UDP-N-acetylglucosamine 2-epimerase n=1 Tax=Wukongibacter baidiensis TaxID=1723361 RepID=UPI003D7FEDFB